MRAKLRRRKRIAEFIRSWVYVIVSCVFLTGSVFIALKEAMDYYAAPEYDIETVEVYPIVEAEDIKPDEHIPDPPKEADKMVVWIETVHHIPFEAEDTYISDEIQMLCVLIGNETGYCPEFLMSIIEAESSGRQYAENGPCKGLMQINTDWLEIAEYMAQHGYTDIYDYETNIRLGCFVLDQKREIYGDDIYAVLMAYNGSSNVSERVENGDYTDYAVGVVDRTWELERLHGK